MNIVYKISLPIIYIKCQVAKMSGSEHVQVAKVLVANRSGSEHELTINRHLKHYYSKMDRCSNLECRLSNEEY